ncbi:unnamed protein product, partial [Mesorhabditis belari]|uniref:ShKT domain-containing protein n=1 Tax=Mesorhabditis belari TaxID=2138241 RepID=A0AAF3FRU1_9BILA
MARLILPVFIVAFAGVAMVFGCSDLSSSCSYWQVNFFCNNTNYTLAQRQKYCGVTCNLCNATTGNSTCGDNASSASCTAWIANGFCSSSFYSLSTRQLYCGTSCSLC